MNSKLFDATLERVAKTWKTYISAICILYLTLIIDALSGFSFLRGINPIDLAGFKVVREALSATYGILFAVFVVSTFLESRLLKTCSSTSNLAKSNGLAVLDLWFLSPFSSSSLLSKAFWFFFIDGFLFLALFSFVHIALISPPNPARMMPEIYFAIGVVDSVLLVICAPFGYLTYRNFQYVRALLRELNFEVQDALRNEAHRSCYSD